MAYFLFLLVNASLMLRPAEIVNDWAELPIYNMLMIACLVASVLPILRQLTPQVLASTPITVCVLGLFAAVVLSHVANGNLLYARLMGYEFLKTVAYYLLLIGLVDSRERLRGFFRTLVLMIGLMATLTLLHHHGVIELQSLETLTRDEIDPSTGQVYSILQLQGTGIFNDPNDLCLILIVGMALCLCLMFGSDGGLFRLFWLAPLMLFGYTLALTNSRGGFLGLLVGIMAGLMARFGAKRSIPLMILTIPAMFVLFAGRQTNLSTSSGTGQARVQLCLAGLGVFRNSPLFGIGQGLCAETIGQETHHSFIHCYPDMGFLGGTLFLAMYALSFECLAKLGRRGIEVIDHELRRMRPYLVGMLVGYATGMCSVSRAYIVPTYMIPALIVVYARLAATDPPTSHRRLDGRFVRDATLLGLAFLVVAHIYVHFFARFG